MFVIFVRGEESPFIDLHEQSGEGVHSLKLELPEKAATTLTHVLGLDSYAVADALGQLWLSAFNAGQRGRLSASPGPESTPDEPHRLGP